MTALLPSKVMILLLASCLMWVGLIALAVMVFSGVTVTTGWIVAASMALAVFAGLLVMFRELREAVVAPVDPASGEDGEEMLETMTSRPRVALPDRISNGQRGMIPLRSRLQPRKRRSRHTSFSETSGNR